MFLLVFCSCLFRVYFLVLFLLLLVFGFFFWLFEIVFFFVNSNKDNITDTVVYVSFLFFLFFLSNYKIAEYCKSLLCVY